MKRIGRADPSGRGWFWTVNAAAILTGMAVFGGRPLVSYKALALGAGPVQLGIIAASFAGLAAILALPVGRYMDRHGARGILLGGLVLLAASLLLLAVSHSIATLAASQLLLGAGHLAVVLGCQSLITTLSTRSEQPRRIGTYTTATSLGQVIGPALVGTLASAGSAPGLDSTFLFLAAGWTLLVLIPAFRLPRPLPHQPGPDERRPSIAQALRQPGIRPALVGGVSGLLALDILVAYLPAYGEQRGIGAHTIGFALSVLALSQMLVRFVLRQLLSRFAPARLLAASVLIPALAIPLTAFPLSDWQLMAVMAIIGLALGICQPMSLVLTVNSAPPSARGMAMGIRIAGNRIAVFLLPAALSVTIGQAGVAAIFGGLSVIMVSATGYVVASRQPGADPAVTD